MSWEHWRTLGDFPQYEVSNYGHLREIESGALVPQVRSGRGFTVSILDQSSTKRVVAVDVLVAGAFVTRVTPEDVVAHIDGSDTNNAAVNLKWVTPKAKRPPVAVEPVKAPAEPRARRRQHDPNARLTLEEQAEIRGRLRNQEPMRFLAQEFGVPEATIRKTVVLDSALTKRLRRRR